jgi:hypothetical protein
MYKPIREVYFLDCFYFNYNGIDRLLRLLGD